MREGGGGRRKDSDWGNLNEKGQLWEINKA